VALGSGAVLLDAENEAVVLSNSRPFLLSKSHYSTVRQKDCLQSILVSTRCGMPLSDIKASFNPKMVVIYRTISFRSFLIGANAKTIIINQTA